MINVFPIFNCLLLTINRVLVRESYETFRRRDVYIISMGEGKLKNYQKERVLHIY